MDTVLINLAMSAATAAIGVVVGWALGDIRGASRERRENKKEQQEERDQVRRILRSLLFCRLSDMHRRYVVDEVPCTPADKQEAESIYSEYHGLGGNGSGTALYEEIMAAHVA